MHEKNIFVTLTYSPEKLPLGGSLDKTHFQKFMKRLRKEFGSEKIRYLQCGEYGDKTSRPHYHAIFFGFDFPDKVFHKKHMGNRLYTSDSLDRIWGHGICWIGGFSFDSAAYVARYIVKKQNGEKADEHYCDKQTGLIRDPEYITMSRRPGIAMEWYKKFAHDTYKDDYVVVNAKKIRPPKYYDRMYDIDSKAEFAIIKQKRRIAGKILTKVNTRERLKAREAVLASRHKIYNPRRYENENAVCDSRHESPSVFPTVRSEEQHGGLERILGSGE